MRRRSLLVSLGAGLTFPLSGCAAIGPEEPNSENGHNGPDVGTQPPVSFNMDPVTDLEIARRVTFPIDDEINHSEREFAAEVIADGTVTTTATNRPAPEDTPFVYDGAVYELPYEIDESVPATLFRVAFEEHDGDIDEAEIIEYDDLPEVDKRHLEDYGWDDGGTFELTNVAFLYLEDDIVESVFVPDPKHPVIKWDSDTFGRVAIEGSDDTDVNTYEYMAHQVHESAEEFGHDFRDNHEFSLSGLSEDQEAIISEATADDDEYQVEEGEPPEEFDQLTDQFSEQPKAERVDREADDSTLSGEYLVGYDGDTYWTELYIIGGDGYA
ncbi:hypothetical protein [Haloferax sp. Atlit-6N]|uniref:hypothetical protein n=1 Tax=Haloferax sp. Atlit-6N TaxID=2077205 RepID=UPI0011C03B73|nr:hypothetical protein [Haloferax sp. Atlit-6N]